MPSPTETKCPIEVGVASEVRNAANPDIMGLYDEMGHFADLSSASSKRLEINAPSPRSPHLQETRTSTAKYEGPRQRWTSDQGHTQDRPLQRGSVEVNAALN